MTQAAASLPIDPFFEVIPDGQWNACVGIQGSPENYIDGYIEAADELVAAVIDRRLLSRRDTLVMPILYNCRHAVELALKFAIDRLHAINVIAQPHAVNHDILSHWTHLRDAQVGDASLNAIIVELEPFVASLAAVDDDGQELRYAQTREGERSLSGIAVVNLLLVRQSIGLLSQILERLKNRVFDLEDDEITGSHTREVSRADLVTITQVLGNHASWRDADFAEKKATVMANLNLGSRKFGQAVDAIRASRPLAAMVGLESDLRFLGDDKAVAALKLWAEAFPVVEPKPADLGRDFKKDNWNRMRVHAERTRILIDGTISLLTPEEFADLETVFYLGRNREHGEHYDDNLDRTLAQHAVHSSRVASVRHIMTKSNLLEETINGATRAGRPGLAAKLRAIRPA
jgi:hypothetical protein